MTTSTNSQSFVPTAQELAAMSDIEFAAVWYRTEARLAADPAPEHHELMELLATHDVAEAEAVRRREARIPAYAFAERYGRPSTDRRSSDPRRRGWCATGLF